MTSPYGHLAWTTVRVYNHSPLHPTHSVYSTLNHSVKMLLFHLLITLLSHFSLMGHTKHIYPELSLWPGQVLKYTKEKQLSSICPHRLFFAEGPVCQILFISPPTVHLSCYAQNTTLLIGYYSNTPGQPTLPFVMTCRDLMHTTKPTCHFCLLPCYGFQQGHPRVDIPLGFASQNKI